MKTKRARWKVCERLKSHPLTRGIELIVQSGTIAKLVRHLLGEN